jgi:hypothetical protein
LPLPSAFFAFLDENFAGHMSDASTTDVPVAPLAVPPHVQILQMAGGHIVATALDAVAELVAPAGITCPTRPAQQMRYFQRDS